ncbi:T9SS type A sorting domain-containing protein [Hyunsoonleella ulvae]|uniref:T9SS type A sorting domain-containing protein n=1 Tax=Hyunsoonleella ulvae TaxID=2799948 RepID=UPI0019392D41|nr:T9SS type A sorting domain-containing protein [Hyunsoonleella ulvae]
MKQLYLLLSVLITSLSFSQTYDYSLSFRGTNASTSNYQIALIATPDFTQSVDAPSADIGVALYIPSGYSLGNFESGNSGLQNTEWTNTQENSYDGNTTDLVQLLRTDMIPNDFTHTSGQTIELVLFDIISDLGNGNNPNSGEITIAENTDANVIDNYYETYLNVNLQDGNGTQNYFGQNHPTAKTISFSTLSIDDNGVLTDIYLHPNPTKNYINIASPNFTIESIEVYTITGQLIERKTTSLETINLKDANNGVYFIKLSDTLNNTKTFKVVKE